MKGVWMCLVVGDGALGIKQRQKGQAEEKGGGPNTWRVMRTYKVLSLVECTISWLC